MWRVNGMLTGSEGKGGMGEGRKTRGNEVNNVTMSC